jgi:hypothetical protein
MAYEGMPGAGGPLGQMLLSSLGGMFSPTGMMPMGLTEQNMYDRVQRMEMEEAHNEFLKQASRQDEDTYFQSLRGLAALSGTPWGGEQMRGAESLSKQMAAMGPFAVRAMGTEFLDQLGGMRGMNVAMAEHLFQGGQFRIDPTTGQSGMSNEALTELQNTLKEEMLVGENWQQRSSGLSAGQLGQTFEELQRAGMVGAAQLDEILLQAAGRPTGDTPQITQEDMDVIFDKAADLGLDLGEGPGVDPRAAGRKAELNFDDLGPEDIQALREDPGVTSVMQSFDSKKVIRAVESYSGVVKAMREIFGDAGYPNAPIPELINAMNQLTGGAAPQLSGEEVEGMVRQTMNLAHNTGLGLEATMMMSEAANAHAMQMGLNPVFGAEALQHGLAFRGAYQQLGMGTPAWGASSMDELAMQDVALTNAAAASSLGNQMGAAMRMREAGQGFTKGTDAQNAKAQAWLAALEVGADEFTYTDENGNQATQSVSMGEAEFTEMMTAATDMDEATVTRLLNQQPTNQEYIQQFDIQDIVRRQQPQEFEDMMIAEAEFNAQERIESLGVAGVDRDAQRGLGTAITQAAAARAGEMSTAQLADQDTRLSEMSRAMMDELESLATGATTIEGVSQEQAQAMLDRMGGDEQLQASVAEELWGAFETASRDPANGFGARSLQDNLRLMSGRAMDQTARNQAQARAEAMAQRAMAPLGGGSLLRRGMQAVLDADDAKGLGDVLSETLGGTTGQEMADALNVQYEDEEGNQTGRTVLEEMRFRESEFQRLRGEYEQAGTPQERAASLGQFQAAEAAYQEVLGDIGATARRHGMRLDARVGQEDVANAQRATSQVDALLRERDEDPKAWKENQERNEAKLERLVEVERSRNDEMLAGIYSDKGAMARMGTVGREHMRKLQDNQSRLDYLAATYAGGDMAALLRGEYDDDVTPEQVAALNAEIFEEAKLDKKGNVMDPGGLLAQKRIAQDAIFQRMKGDDGIDYLTDAAGLKPVVEKITKQPPYSGYADDVTALEEIEAVDLDKLVETGKITEDERATFEQAQEEYNTFMESMFDQRADYTKSARELMAEGMARRGAKPGDTDEDIAKAAERLSDEQLEDYYGEENYAKLLESMEAEGPGGTMVRASFSELMRDTDRIAKMEATDEMGRQYLDDNLTEAVEEITTGVLEEGEQEPQEIVLRVDGANITINRDDDTVAMEGDGVVEAGHVQ